jgi:predicted acyltransferase
VFPINKSLWTSSYTVFTAGLASILLAGCYWVIDVRRWRKWATPFVVFGVNAIAAYFLSALFARTIDMIQVGDASLKAWVYRELFVPWAGPMNGSLAFALAFVAVWMGLMWILYRRRIFIKI